MFRTNSGQEKIKNTILAPVMDEQLFDGYMEAFDQDAEENGSEKCD